MSGRVTVFAPSEKQLHKTILDYLRLRLPADAIVHHSPNEGKRGFQAQGDFKRLGSMSGMPDLMILCRGNTYFLEIKTVMGRVSPGQNRALSALRMAGFPAEVVRSVGDVEKHLNNWIPQGVLRHVK